MQRKESMPVQHYFHPTPDSFANGPEGSQSFFGLSLESQRDMLLFLVEEHLSRDILEHIAEIGGFEQNPGAGIAFQLDVEDAVGVNRQVIKLTEVVEDKI